MSIRIGDISIICVEPDQPCEYCGQITETRPYGPNGEQICYACAMLNPFETEVQMYIRLVGMDRSEAERAVRSRGIPETQQ